MDDSDALRVISDQLEKLLPRAFANRQSRPRENIPVFRKDRFGDREPCGAGEGEQENSSLKSVRFQCSGDNDVGVQDEAEGYRRSALALAEIHRSGGGAARPVQDSSNRIK